MLPFTLKVVLVMKEINAISCEKSLHTWTRQQWDLLLMVERCFFNKGGVPSRIAFNVCKIISHQLQTALSRLRLSAYALSYIWGQYILTTEHNKYTFQYAYHTIQHAQNECFPASLQQILSFHDICVAYIPIIGLRFTG